MEEPVPLSAFTAVLPEEEEVIEESAALSALVHDLARVEEEAIGWAQPLF